MRGRLRLGRRRIPVEDGDSIASSLYRAGIRTFSRSLKYHRRRGLLCGTGDCPNCLVTVDRVPGVRSCVTAARDGMRVRREGGWPSVERDVLSVLDRLHVFLPENAAGAQVERWFHLLGCRRWITVTRDTTTNEVR